MMNLIMIKMYIKFDVGVVENIYLSIRIFEFFVID